MLGNEKGFQILETVVAMAAISVFLFWAKDHVQLTLQMQEIVRHRTYLGELEQNLRRSVQDDAAFAINLQKNPKLKSCWELDGVPCSQASQDLTLVSLREQRLSGAFPAPGKSCDPQKDCPIFIRTSFRAVCGDGQASCEMASAVLIDYSIELKEDLTKRLVVKQGYLQKMNAARLVNDDNINCPLSSDGLVTFAQAIGPLKLNCVKPAPFQRTLAGVTPKTCDPAKQEILQGFDANGLAICAVAKGSMP